MHKPKNRSRFRKEATAFFCKVASRKGPRYASSGDFAKKIRIAKKGVFFDMIVYFTCNSSFFKYGKVLIQSLYKNMGVGDVSSVVIQDCGLTGSEREFFSGFDKVRFIDGVSCQSNQQWDKGWLAVVGSKVHGLLKLVDEGIFPIVMIDSDCYIVRDFGDCVNMKYPVQIMHRKTKVPILASFMIINDGGHGRNYVKTVIDRLSKQQYTKAKKQGRFRPQESRMFSTVWREAKKKICFDLLNVDLFSSSPIHFLRGQTKSSVRVVHFKGDTGKNWFARFYKEHCVGYK